MKIRMKVDMSGTLNGAPWPGRGGTVDVPDVVGAKLCAAGHADPVADKDADIETRDDELDELHDQAKAAGVKVDKRWGADRLREEIASATEE